MKDKKSLLFKGDLRKVGGFKLPERGRIKKKRREVDKMDCCYLAARELLGKGGLFPARASAGFCRCGWRNDVPSGELLVRKPNPRTPVTVV
jgi:hypothetical protein